MVRPSLLMAFLLKVVVDLGEAAQVPLGILGLSTETSEEHWCEL